MGLSLRGSACFLLRYDADRRVVDKSRTCYYIADTPDPDELLDAAVFVAK